MDKNRRQVFCFWCCMFAFVMRAADAGHVLDVPQHFLFLCPVAPTFL